MTTTTLKLEAIFQDGHVDTLDKPYTACWMAFSPHSGCDWVFGETEKVKAYWESLECSFDYQWFLFDSKAELLESLKEVEKEMETFSYSTFYPVDTCLLGTEPEMKNAVKPSFIQE